MVILQPSFINHEKALDVQFQGMTKEKFTYQMFENERKHLVEVIHNQLTVAQKKLLLSFIEGRPNWIYDDWSRFPGIAWKMKNLEILKEKYPEKFNKQISLTSKILTGTDL